MLLLLARSKEVSFENDKRGLSICNLILRGRLHRSIRNNDYLQLLI